MKWFMSYVQVYQDGRHMFGATTWEGVVHPIDMIKRWNEDYGEKERFQAVPISFQQLPPGSPEFDILSHGIGE